MCYLRSDGGPRTKITVCSVAFSTLMTPRQKKHFRCVRCCLPDPLLSTTRTWGGLQRQGSKGKDKSTQTPWQYAAVSCLHRVKGDGGLGGGGGWGQVELHLEAPCRQRAHPCKALARSIVPLGPAQSCRDRARDGGGGCPLQTGWCGGRLLACLSHPPPLSILDPAFYTWHSCG